MRFGTDAQLGNETHHARAGLGKELCRVQWAFVFWPFPTGTHAGAMLSRKLCTRREASTWKSGGHPKVFLRHIGTMAVENASVGGRASPCAEAGEGSIAHNATEVD